ncbi:MAG: helix-turn-helix domain-containing protein [Acetobacteraceae bacterium]
MHASASHSPVMSPRPPAVATPDALDLLEQFGTTVRLQRDGEIHAEGDDAQACYRVISGCARSVTLLEDGRRQVGEFFLPGEWIGLHDLDTYDYAAEAVTDVVLRRYPRRMVEALAESNGPLSRRLRELALRSLRIAHARMVMLARKTATERIASFLLEMDRRTGNTGNPKLELPMNRADMADHLGLTVETICRVLAHLKRDGLLRIMRTGVELRDRDGLRDLARGASPVLL